MVVPADMLFVPPLFGFRMETVAPDKKAITISGPGNSVADVDALAGTG
jgi:hypothetical protein